MSADHWAAFAGASDDLSKNPWSSSSPTGAGPSSAHNQVEKTSSVTQPQQQSLGVSFSQQPQSPWARPQPKSPPPSLPPGSIPKASGPWVASDSSKADEWSGWESPTVAANAWSQDGRIADPVSNPMLPEDQAPLDGWGEFKAPEKAISRSLGALRVQDDSQEPSNESIGTTTTYSIPAYTPAAGKSSQSTESKFVAGSEQSVKYQSKKFQAIHPSNHEPKREDPIADEIVPYTEEEWGEFSPDPATSPEFPRSTSTITQKLASHSQPQIREQTQEERSRKTQSQPQRLKSITSVMPPSNVPPPSILMSLVSSLVERLPLQVESAMQNFSQTRGSDKTLEAALRKCTSSLRVAARITAGRKIRWKRDTHLAQSMRIGQAGKGMKLSGVDRNELKREDREAAEFVQIWQKRLGNIRKALAMVNSQISGSPLALPDIGEIMPIRTVKPTDGGIVAPKCCVLCGIKRDERVEKVDVDVYDAFNEWWVEHWGHSDCMTFWTEHEQYLQQR